MAKIPAETAKGYLMLSVKKQDLRSYTPAQNSLWQLLFEEMRMHVWPGRVDDMYLDSLAKLPITGDAIPDLDEVGAALQAGSGWQIVGVGELATPADLVECMANRQFPVCVEMRDEEHMYFSPRPDIWHDLMGHAVPLMNPLFADCMHSFGVQGKKAMEHGHLDLWDRVFYQSEVGVIKTPKGFRLYGPAAVTSKHEALSCLDPLSIRLRFNLERIMRTPSTDTTVQRQHYYIDSYKQLYAFLQKDWLPLYRKVTSSSREFA